MRAKAIFFDRAVSEVLDLFFALGFWL